MKRSKPVIDNICKQPRLTQFFQSKLVSVGGTRNECDEPTEEEFNEKEKIDKSEKHSIDLTLDPKITDSLPGCSKTNSISNPGLLLKEETSSLLPATRPKPVSQGKRQFKEEWKQTLKWLNYNAETGIANCSLCYLFPELADQSSKVVQGFTAPFKLETFKKHDKSHQHLKCVNAKMAIENPESAPLAKCVKQMDKKMFDHLGTLFTCAYYIAKNNKPFHDMKGLLVLIKKFHTVLDQYNNDKACKEFIVNIAHVIRKEFIMELKDCSYVSLLLDASTDKGGEEELVIHVRYIKNKKVQESFLTIIPMISGTSEGYFNTIQQELKQLGLEHWMSGNCLVGIGTDGAPAMIGRENGLVAKFKQLPGLHHLVGVHCIAHKLNLSVLSSVKNVKYLEKVDNLLKKMYQFYQYSPKRLRELREVAAILENEITKFQYLHSVRWVASKVGALQALVKNYGSVIVHLESISNGKGDDASTAKGLLKDLKDFRFVVSVHFLLDFLGIFTSLSLMFQKCDLLLSLVELHVKKGIASLEELKNNPGQMENYVLSNTSLKGVYKDVQLTGVGNKFFESDKENLIINGIKYLEERFLNDVQQISHATSIFDTFGWPSGQELLQYGKKELEILTLHFSKQLVSSKEEIETLIRDINNEWYEFKVLGKGLRLEELLEKVISMENRFPLLSKLLCILSVLPVSTASCERGFSLMNIIKTQLRSSMEAQCINDLMTINCNGPSVQDFDPTKYVDYWYFNTKTSRHVHGHKLPTSSFASLK